MVEPPEPLEPPEPELPPAPPVPVEHLPPEHRSPPQQSPETAQFWPGLEHGLAHFPAGPQMSPWVEQQSDESTQFVPAEPHCLTQRPPVHAIPVQHSPVLAHASPAPVHASQLPSLQILEQHWSEFAQPEPSVPHESQRFW